MLFPLFEAWDLDLGRLRITRTDGGRLLLPVAPCLIRVPDRLVLVDAGFDPDLEDREERVAWERPDHDLIQQLEALGLWPDDVSDVVLTHLHDDHSGGVLDRQREQPVFPNARVHLQELALWRGFDRISRGGERFISELLLDYLDQSPLTVRHQGDWRLCEGIHVCHTGGHTPGHQVVHAGDALLARDNLDGLVWRQADGATRGSLLLGGDLLSLKACFNPGFRTSSDVEPERALARRRELTTDAQGLCYYLYHGNPGHRFWNPPEKQTRGDT